MGKLCAGGLTGCRKVFEKFETERYGTLLHSHGLKQLGKKKGARMDVAVGNTDSLATDKLSATSSATPPCRNEHEHRPSYSSARCTAIRAQPRLRTGVSWEGREEECSEIFGWPG